MRYKQRCKPNTKRYMNQGATYHDQCLDNLYSKTKLNNFAVMRKRPTTNRGQTLNLSHKSHSHHSQDLTLQFAYSQYLPSLHAHSTKAVTGHIAASPKWLRVHGIHGFALLFYEVLLIK